MSRLLIAAVLLAACAPQVDGPVDHQRSLDRQDADRLAGQLAQLPGAVHAEVTLHRSVVDPLQLGPAKPASAAVLVVVDDRADRAAIEHATKQLVHGSAPEIADASIVVELGAVRPVLARVGPFTVEASSKSSLVTVLATALGMIAMLAGWIAWRERQRRGNSAQ